MGSNSGYFLKCFLLQAEECLYLNIFFQFRAKKGNKKPKFSMRKILRKNDKIWSKDWKPKIAKLCNSNDPFLFEWFLTPRSTIRKLSNSSKICLWLMKHHQARQCKLKFVYSEKATKFCQISTCMYCRQK